MFGCLLSFPLPLLSTSAQTVNLDSALLLFSLYKSPSGEDDYNMDLCHQVKHRLQTTHKVKKVISHWLPCVVKDGRTVT